MASKKVSSKKQITVVLPPGKVALQGFFKENSKLFNISEMERVADLPPSTLRHICAGNRDMQQDEYEQLKKAILPKLCEFVLFLQNYD